MFSSFSDQQLIPQRCCKTNPQNPIFRMVFLVVDPSISWFRDVDSRSSTLNRLEYVNANIFLKNFDFDDEGDFLKQLQDTSTKRGDDEWFWMQ